MCSPQAENCTLPHCQCGCASQQIQVANVRFGSKADITRDQLNVRFTPKSGHSIATCLYKAECVVRARRRWHLSQITDEIEPSERGRHVLGARKKSERETRKLRCAKPSAPKSSRRRMKPILDRTKSKAEAYAPAQRGKAPSRLHSVFAFFGWNFRDCLLWKALRQSAAVRCALRPRMVTPILALNAANVLQRFPPRECSLYSHAKCMFIVFRMLFDSSICPRNPATSGGTSRVLCEDFRQRVCELISQCSNIGV